MIELVLVEPFLGCVVVTAVPPAHSPLVSDSLALPLVRFQVHEFQVDTADFILRLAS